MSPVLRPKMAPALGCAMLLLLTGCLQSVRVGAAPTVTTDGMVGGHIWVGGQLGITLLHARRTPALGVVVETAAGGFFRPRMPSLQLRNGFDLSVVTDTELHYRLGLRMGANWLLDDDRRPFLTAEFVGAFSPPRMQRLHLALESRIGFMFQEEENTNRYLGTFSLGIVYEHIARQNPLSRH